jgi:D-alanine-D-alanine ligase
MVGAPRRPTRMKIVVLTHLEKEGAKTRDTVVDQVTEALKAKGHDASVLGVYNDIKKLVAGLTEPRPDLVFNLMEMFGDDNFGDVDVAGMLDLLDLPHTGGGAGEIFLRQDKALAKKLLAYDGILFPKYAVFPKNAGFETGGNLRMPLFVKPLRLDASMGIDGKSLVNDAASLMKRVVQIHEKLNDAALAEEFIEGREFYVGVLGNGDAQAFPPIEMDFSGLPEGVPHVADSKAKWEKDSIEYKGTKSIIAAVPDELRARLQRVALDAYRALRVRDYGRVDLRLTTTGDIYVIEVNASCYLEKESEFATAAAAAGIAYPDLVQRIVDLAVERHKDAMAAPKRRRPSRRKSEPAAT